MNWDKERAICSSVFSQLGESCPKLKYLKLGPDFSLSVDDVVALLLTKRAKLFPTGKNSKSWVYIYGLHRIQVASEHLAPFCQSLEFLGFQHHSGSNLLYEYLDGLVLFNI